ncbi:arginase family protein [Aspergillus undulatus]|uniref:arginase family protein n=1 Tax=Aspergillus undulatus TaxID=1810928 RepID=UPI003CCCF13B
MDIFQAVCIIFSPYHVGLRDHRVGNGPHRIRSTGLERELQRLGVSVDFVEIEPVDDYEGEIGRSFEVMRRISRAVSDAIASKSFPLVLSGNCMASAAVACGLQIQDLAFIYFDAHDDLDSPDTLMRSVPGFRPFDYSRFLYCGLRDQSSIQRQRVIDAGMHSIWGNTKEKVDFAAELKTRLEERSYSPALVHLDLDVLDDSYGKVNDYPSPGGLFESDLISCMEIVPQITRPTSLTVCSFDPDAGDGDRIAQIGSRAITTFVKALLSKGALSNNLKA